ncbi:MAG: Crp/Fnr family transcriptional regulator [Proteobacteria bacterium]|nr:Crp/Fnr family transcriptional regulator [Pseudomonadota bacterium]
MGPSLKENALNQIPLFSSLEPEQLKHIAELCKRKTFAKDDYILYQGDLQKELYIILSGRVSVVLSSEEGREIVLDEFGEGGFFGELSLLDEKPRSASVKAISDVRTIVLEKKDFIRIVKANPDISINILAIMGERLRKADDKVSTLAFMDVCGRVAKFILNLAEDNGEKIEEGKISIKPVTHQFIADQIGASRESVTKALKTLAKQGLVETNGRALSIDSGQLEIF